MRVREANALAAMGKVDAAVNKLEEAMLLENRVEMSGLPAIEKLLSQLKQGQQNLALAQISLQKNEFTRAKRLFQLSQSVMTHDSRVLLGLSKCFLGLGEFDDASREAQKVVIFHVLAVEQIIASINSTVMISLFIQSLHILILP